MSFKNAWKATCSAREVSGFSPTMHVPDGYKFMLQPVIFSGPCNSETVNVMHPVILQNGSATEVTAVNGHTEINGLYIYGFGTINTQGTKWWGSSNVNRTRKYHGSKPTDSPQMHMALERSTWVYVYNLTITALGDDCISIGDGSSYLNISMIACGPGHGIRYKRAI
ncbi:unnamed protein product [Camellia sinensis]